MSEYNKAFYRDQMKQSKISASHIIPILHQYLTPRSVVDIGCGCGSWLSEFKRFGAKKVLGVDGAYVDRDMLEIEPSEFLVNDLNQCFALDVSERYDLAVSLEVAEHIEPCNSEQFVAFLAGLSDIVLFSAALPYQGGTSHVNENWLEYWAILFREHGYVPIDCIRPVIWTDNDICWWYRQNIILFVEEAVAKEKFGQIPGDAATLLSYVHPELFLDVCNRSLLGRKRQAVNDAVYYNNICDVYHRQTNKSTSIEIVNYRNTYNVKFYGFNNLLRKIISYLKFLKL